MNSIKTNNCYKKIFNNEATKQFTNSFSGETCEISCHDEGKYLKIFRNEKKRDNLKEILLDPGFSNSQRILEVDYIFNTSKDADNFMNEISRKGLYYLLAIEGYKGAWNVIGFIKVNSSEIDRIIKVIENIIKKYNTQKFIDWVSIRFLD